MDRDDMENLDEATERDMFLGCRRGFAKKCSKTVLECFLGEADFRGFRCFNAFQVSGFWCLADSRS